MNLSKDKNEKKKNVLQGNSVLVFKLKSVVDGRLRFHLFFFYCLWGWVMEILNFVSDVLDLEKK